MGQAMTTAKEGNILTQVNHLADVVEKSKSWLEESVIDESTAAACVGVILGFSLSSLIYGLVFIQFSFTCK